MTKLTEPQRTLLSRAAAEPDGATAAGSNVKLTQSLIRRGFAMVLPGAEGAANRLMITAAGRAALEPEPDGAGGEAPAADQPAPDEAAANPAEAAEDDNPAGSDTRGPPPARPRKTSPGGKLGTLVELLQRPQGATVEQMSQATDWLLHSVRGAMAGALKNRFGFSITSEKQDGVRVYRIGAAE